MRTIYEEAWSEIDHELRYSVETNNDLINRLLLIFNLLSGLADDIGSFVKLLKQDMKGGTICKANARKGLNIFQTAGYN